jgi:hypothetical protein
MKKALSLATLVASFGFFTLLFAAPTSVHGYIMDSGCANGPHKMAMKGNAQCAKNCMKRGAAAVLVEDGSAGTVLKIANQAKVKALAGRHVVLTGTIEDGTMTVTSAKAAK